MPIYLSEPAAPAPGSVLAWVYLAVVAVASNQLSFSVALDQAGHCQLLGDAANVTVDHIYAAILARMNNPLLDQSPYALTDGWGATAMYCDVRYPG